MGLMDSKEKGDSKGIQGTQASPGSKVRKVREGTMTSQGSKVYEGGDPDHLGVQGKKGEVGDLITWGSKVRKERRVP